MRFPIAFPFGLAILSSITSCQPIQVLASMEHNYDPDARAYMTGDVIWVEVKVPLVTGVDSWHATFEGEVPDGFSSNTTAKETVFTWIVDKNHITWFGTNGYLLKLTGGEYSRSVKVKAIKQSAVVAQWVVRVLMLGAH